RFLKIQVLRLARLSTVANTVLLAGLLACGHDKSDSAKSETGFRVALLTPGPISDQSWNAGAYKGLEQIHDSLGASISHIQTKTPAEFEDNFRQYGSKRFQ